MDEKYVVFKVEAMRNFTTHLGQIASECTRINNERIIGAIDKLDKQGEVEDAVVIRRQDQFAPAALYAYAGAVQSVKEIMMTVNVEMDQEEYGRVMGNLERIHDYFMNQAELSQSEMRKVPD